MEVEVQRVASTLTYFQIRLLQSLISANKGFFTNNEIPLKYNYQVLIVALQQKPKFYTGNLIGHTNLLKRPDLGHDSQMIKIIHKIYHASVDI